MGETGAEDKLAGFIARFTPEIGALATAASPPCGRVCPARR